MARIAVHRRSFEEGTFPPVCCKTGVHTDNYETWEFTHMPAWTWILLLFGILPFVIASFFTTKRFHGRLPMTGAARYRAAKAKLAVWIFGLLAIGAALVGILTASRLIGGVVIALASGWLISVILALVWAPNAKPFGDGTVELSNVHRRFVETIEAAWAQQRPDQRTD